MLSVASCEKSIEPADPVEEGKGTIDICVNGLMGEYTQQDGVKSSLVNNVRVAWAAGDVVYVFDGSKYLGKLTAALDKKADGKTDEDRYAKLGGTINAPATTPCVLSLVHSSLMTEPETGAAVSELSIDMSAQSTATVPFVAYATLEYTGTTITDVVVPFQFATSVIKVNCTGLKANTAIDKATLDNVNTKCKLTLSGSAAPTVSGDINGTITRTGDTYFADGKVNSEGEAVFQIAVPALEETSGTRLLTITQGTDIFMDVKFSTKSIGSATSVNTVCQLLAVPDGALPGVFTVSNYGKKVFFSKGNLTYDVEATTNKWKFYEHQYDRADNGSASATLISLFTWGYSASTSLVYNGSAYVTDHTTDGDKLLVYDKASSEGGDDWGVAYCESNNITVGTWRTLSNDEWKYLFKTRTMKKGKDRYTLNITYGGKMGLVLYPDDYSGPTLISGKDYTDANFPADCVFLPAAGYRDGSNVSILDNGLYWSSTAYNEYNAYFVNFFRNYPYLGNSEARKSGCSVRLVTECQ